jgi:hypothetical protein
MKRGAHAALIAQGSLIKASVLVAAIGIVSSCASVRERKLPDLMLSDGTTVNGIVLLEHADTSIAVFYQSRHSSSDCQNIMDEVRAVWTAGVESEASRRGASSATLWPEGTTSGGRSYTYKRSDGQWIEWNFGSCR